ncbi:LOW QUALITY PROTEIN: hypothetical protein M8C21_010138 [Ambrosia artemisiifolia]|uniref:Uncharacterized protein n=1 Tax=Ambrosia artemisiifolia TaxID=4212 RepID=A0AAD5DAW9_AMBAR|nr:LOW QUALITY PROTEIN: hypothetical protein M8C21_010138 [Ambrosia artemisiifolia]
MLSSLLTISRLTEKKIVSSSGIW